MDSGLARNPESQHNWASQKNKNYHHNAENWIQNDAKTGKDDEEFGIQSSDIYVRSMARHIISINPK